MATEILNEFELEKHSGPYEKWPSGSYVIRNGRPTSLRLPGYLLLHQFLMRDEYLFVTNYDCPFEEITELTLCSASLSIVARRSFGCPYASVDLDRARIVGEDQILIFSDSGEARLITIGRSGIPFFSSRLKVARPSHFQRIELFSHST